MRGSAWTQLWRTIQSLIATASLNIMLVALRPTTALGHLYPFPALDWNVRSSQDRSFLMRKADIASPLTGMRTIPAVPDDLR